MSLSKRTVGLMAAAAVALAGAASLALTARGSGPSPADLRPSPPATTPAGTPSASPTATPASNGPVTVSGIVRIKPMKGWTVHYLFLTHDPPYLRLVRDQVRLNVLAGRFPGSPTDLATSYADRFVTPFEAGSPATPSRHWIKLPSGIVALRLVYAGPFGHGGTAGVHELTVFRHGPDGVVFDSWGDSVRFDAAHADLQSMVASAVLR